MCIIKICVICENKRQDKYKNKQDKYKNKHIQFI
jgi:hypothetical protein